jgi:hypothetical protein
MTSKQYEQWRMFFKPDTQPFERFWSDPSHMSLEDVVKGKGEDSESQETTSGYTWRN